MNRLTDFELVELGTAFDSLLETHQDIFDKLSGDGGLEDIMLGIIELVARERSFQTHPLVISCLESVEEALRHAAFDYYASFK